MIKIIKGFYGFVDKNGIVQPKYPSSEPFSAGKEEEERLIKLGVAVSTANKTSTKKKAAQTQTTAPADDAGAPDDLPPIDEVLK